MTYDRGNKKPQNDRGHAKNTFDPRDKKERKPLRTNVTSEESDGSERIAKRLARAGIASRRDAETMIAAGRIIVNGKVLDTPAFNVKRTDAILVDGKPLPPIERTRVWLYHKPAGLVTTNRDPEGRPTVFDSLPEGMPRVLSVGRLDINTEGLLLLTNDGGLARVLELPSTGWVRKYRVRAHGKVTQTDLDALKNGIAIDGIFYGSVEATLEREQGTNVWLTVALREGKNREVKNILGALGLTVARLIRISFGPFQLADLEEGAVRELKGRTLRDQLGERLIADANADFDLPILKPFSNAPVVGEQKLPERPNVSDDGWISSTPEAPRYNKRWKKSDFAERGRAQLSTKPDRFVKKDDGFNGRTKNFKKTPEEKPEAKPQRLRSSNVWMAPGARPQTARKKFWHDRDDEPKDESKQFDNNTYERHPHRASRHESEARFERSKKHFDDRNEKSDFKKRSWDKPFGDKEKDPRSSDRSKRFAKKTWESRSYYETNNKADNKAERPAFDKRALGKPKKHYSASTSANEGGYNTRRRHNESEGQDVIRKRTGRFYKQRSDKQFSSKDDGQKKARFGNRPAKNGKFLKPKGAAKGQGRARSGTRSARPDGGRGADRRG